MSIRSARRRFAIAIAGGMAPLLLITHQSRGTDIIGIQPAALDQPTVNFIFLDPLTSNPATPLYADYGGGLRFFNGEAFLDTGASGIVISRSTAATLTHDGQENTEVTGLGQQTYSNGKYVYFEDVGVAGQTIPRFNVSQSFKLSIAPYTATAAQAISDAETQFGSNTPKSFADVDLTVYNHTTGPIRAQIGPFVGEDPNVPPDPAFAGLDVLGMPAIKGKVMVMDPRPVENLIFGNFDDYRMRTYLYAPGTAAKSSATASDDPGIPKTNRSIRLSYADFDAFSKVGTADTPGGTLTPLPTGAAANYGPSLVHNPFIGPNPLNPAGDTTPPIKISFNGKTTTGSFLLDTGAVASMISSTLAANLNVRYVGSDPNAADPQLEIFDPAHPGNAGTLISDQFQLSIGGVDGTKLVAGFWLTSMLVKTTQGVASNDNDPHHLRFLNAPVLVNDISVLNGTTGQKITLDGIFGMNNLIASAFFHDNGTFIPDIYDLTPSAFDFIAFDEPNQLLNLKLRTPGDADRDGVVGLNDLLSLANNYGTTPTAGDPWAAGDFDGDGIIGLNDLLILANHYGSEDLLDADMLNLPHYQFDIVAGILNATPVPEPASTIPFIIMAGSALLARRRAR